MTPRVSLPSEDEANAGAEEPVVESREEDDGTLAHASAQRKTAGYAERIRNLLSRECGARSRTSHSLDRRAFRPGPNGLGRPVPGFVRGERSWAAADGRWATDGNRERGTGNRASRPGSLG